MSAEVRRLLVTGATGFVGSHTLPLLAAGGWELHATRHTDRDVPAECAVAWHAADLRDPRQCRALIQRVLPTHVLSLAWNAEYGAFWTAEDNEAWADGTIELARAFAEHGGRRFVGAGTCAEYDWTDLSTPCRENLSPCRPQTIYGRAKLRALEGILESADRRNSSAAWGRLFFLFGPGEDDRRLIPSVARALTSGARARVSAGTQLRDFLHVTDAALAFVALLESELTGAVNIGSGRSVTIRTVAETLARLAGRPDGVEYGAMPMQPSEPPMIVADVQRLMSTGWRPMIALEDGLAAIFRQP